MNQLSVTPRNCPHCGSLEFSKKGFFYKKITKTYIPRYRCQECRRSFSTRTLSTTFRQKRPDLNRSIYLSLVSGTSLRRTAQNLECSYLTVCRKFLWLAKRAKELHLSQKFYAEEIQFDEMESIEHTKLKPLTICLAVTSDYRILGVKVGKIPAKGHLAAISRKKYGPRANESNQKTLLYFSPGRRLCRRHGWREPTLASAAIEHGCVRQKEESINPAPKAAPVRSPLM